MTNNPNEPLNFSKTPDENSVPPAPYGAPTQYGPPVTPAPAPTPYSAPAQYGPPAPPQQGQQPYAPQQGSPYQTYAQNVNTSPQNKSNAFALVSFIAGLSQIILAWLVGPLIAIVAIVFGHLALSQIKKTGEQGYVFALVGLIAGYVGLGLTMLFVFWFIFAAMLSS